MAETTVMRLTTLIIILILLSASLTTLYRRVHIIDYVDGADYFHRWLTPASRTALGPIIVRQAFCPWKRPTITFASVFGDAKRAVHRDTLLVIISGEPHPVEPLGGHPRQVIIDCKRTPVGPLATGVRRVYFPFYALSFSERRMHVPADLLHRPGPALKDRFCAYLYSYDHPDRVRFFQALNGQRRVDALGASQNNVGAASHDRFNANFNDIAVEKYLPYRFVMAFENTQVPGYISEKIVSAMLAGAIPIYWGAPDVAAHFNPKSFINVMDFPTFDDCVRHVVSLDEDRAAYDAMRAQPWFPGNKLPDVFDKGYLAALIT